MSDTMRTVAVPGKPIHYAHERSRVRVERLERVARAGREAKRLDRAERYEQRRELRRPTDLVDTFLAVEVG
ncbi:hypothetical protein M3D75_14520 [Microbacterium enclense]|uniref:hypothetical protein n=1 Tax=Microbacterium enclense TaxID=993073 RepID=UPI0021A425F9|nr:hypothetical protein [Microbacterium enclense]MCT2087334.1 hypothetical protein [Microbacterium enclense]